MMDEARRILVVDDQQDILELAATVLSGAGYAVSTADSGIGALDRVAEEPFDLLLLDINMPGMDGWETLRLIRADDRLDSLPVVMFSIKGEVRDKVHGMQGGALDYITKPFEVDELLERVRRIFEKVH
jgi:DNA-binding response OmpR family regulator